MFAYLWQRFLWLGWIGKAVTVILLLYGVAWIVGGLGAEGMAQQLGSAAAIVVAVLATALIIRHLWSNHAGRPRR
jgi:predicted MFS family arabinose efflux permease